MALQPAAGTRDLNPREVDGNRWLSEQLGQVYRLWGYVEVSPPSVERLQTLEAGGRINDREVVRLASDDPLGLRPEMTASIARAACTRMAELPRPLRLWSCGTVFRSVQSDTGQQRLEEQLQSGVELLGGHASVADAELLRLLLACIAKVGIGVEHRPKLLLGHHGVLSALLNQVPPEQRNAVRKALISFDPLALAGLQLPSEQRQSLEQLMRLRGAPDQVLRQLESMLGPSSDLEHLSASLQLVASAATEAHVELQLDPTFQPHFDLYDGLVLKVVCQGVDAPVEIASGGRYDALVERFGGAASGLGFSFDLEAIQGLLGTENTAPQQRAVTLLSVRDLSQLPAAFAAQAEQHAKGQACMLLDRPCGSEAEAQAEAAARGCQAVIWMG